jgi:hypothetical protein
MAAQNTPDIIENAETSIGPGRERSEKDAVDLTRKILFKLDTRCVGHSPRSLFTNRFAAEDHSLTNRSRVLPVVALLFLCSMLDRTNVGNAKIIGMEKDLHISNLQYNQGLAVFYATYIASEVPSNLVLKNTSPKIWLPLLTALWGIITMCIGFVQNFSGFVAVRALLGLAEGGLLPGIVSGQPGSVYTNGGRYCTFLECTREAKWP